MEIPVLFPQMSPSDPLFEKVKDLIPLFVGEKFEEIESVLCETLARVQHAQREQVIGISSDVFPRAHELKGKYESSQD